MLGGPSPSYGWSELLPDLGTSHTTPGLVLSSCPLGDLQDASHGSLYTPTLRSDYTVFLGWVGVPPTQTFGCSLTSELLPGSNRFIRVAVADRGSLDVPVLKVEATEQAGPRDVS